MAYVNLWPMCHCAIIFLFIPTCFSFDIKKSPARVIISEDRSVNDGFMVEIESNGETRQLQLSPMENIWSDEAQLLTITRNEDGEQIFERKDIPKNIKVYHDYEIGSVLSLKDGNINGILDSDYMIQSDEDGNHFVFKSSKKTFDQLDYVKVQEALPEIIVERLPIERNDSIPIPIPLTNRIYPRQETFNIYTVEIAVILDSTLANLIGNDTKCIFYLTVFWNGVNQRFKTIWNPKIIIRIVGSVIIRNAIDEPFITNNTINGTKVDGLKALYSEASWVNSKLATLPDHDIFYLQTGRDLADSAGNSNLAGIAFVAAACIRNSGGRSYATGMGEDRFAFYNGVHTATHEIAHNLGSPHDNDTASGTGNCSWDDGNIMSYKGGVKNHLFFSNCSIRKMSTYLASFSAACVKTNITTTKPPGVYTSTNLPGDVISMDEQCKYISGKSNATVYTGITPEDVHCYNLRCLFQENSTYYLLTSNRAAAEGSTCISGKHCHDGACI